MRPRGADLSGADLFGANLSGVDLSWSRLSRADLRWANLSRANLSEADLREADLSWADLSGAALSWADLSGAALSRANLSEADLSWSNLSRANLSGADLSEADLFGADLNEADLSGTKLPHFQIPNGEISVWKKLRGGLLAELVIPSNAQRTATLIGRKCRAERAHVVAVHNGDTSVEEGVSFHDGTTRYVAGETVYPDRYDGDIRVECASGIHFFMTREEAEAAEEY